MYLVTVAAGRRLLLDIGHLVAAVVVAVGDGDGDLLVVVVAVDVGGRGVAVDCGGLLSVPGLSVSLAAHPYTQSPGKSESINSIRLTKSGH